MTISSSALQGVILLQVISKTVSQFPFPYPPGSQQMFPNMAPMQQVPSSGFVPRSMNYPMQQMPPSSFLPRSMNYPMQQKMPMVVMPYHSRSADKRKRKHHKRRPKKIRFHDSSPEEECSSSEEFEFRAKGKKRRQVLTPVVSYVTKDGYVVYQKKIKKNKAKDWLEMGKRNGASGEGNESDDEREGLLRRLNKLKLARRHHIRYH